MLESQLAKWTATNFEYNGNISIRITEMIFQRTTEERSSPTVGWENKQWWMNEYEGELKKFWFATHQLDSSIEAAIHWALDMHVDVGTVEFRLAKIKCKTLISRFERINEQRCNSKMGGGESNPRFQLLSTPFWKKIKILLVGGGVGSPQLHLYKWKKWLLPQWKYWPFQFP